MYKSGTHCPRCGLPSVGYSESDKPGTCCAEEGYEKEVIDCREREIAALKDRVEQLLGELDAAWERLE
jgi:hypothetical protein